MERIVKLIFTQKRLKVITYRPWKELKNFTFFRRCWLWWTNYVSQSFNEIDVIDELESTLNLHGLKELIPKIKKELKTDPHIQITLTFTTQLSKVQAVNNSMSLLSRH